MSPLKMGSRQVGRVSRRGADRRGRAPSSEALDVRRRRARPGRRARRRARSSTRSASGPRSPATTPSSRSPAPPAAGKSSLFNALVGADVADGRRPAPDDLDARRRPCGATRTPRDLLDWLASAPAAPRRPASADRTRGRREPWNLDGLVLLDLPDFDSRGRRHRVEAERVLELVDVFVWVTDPQKYADARLHDDYLRALSTHDAVTRRRAQPGRPADRRRRSRQCRGGPAAPAGSRGRHAAAPGDRDLGPHRRGRRRPPAAARRTPWPRRTPPGTGSPADIARPPARLRGGVADTEPRARTTRADAELVDALARAAGVPDGASTPSSATTAREAWARTGWPFTRWVRALRPDPLKRLRLDTRARSAGEARRHRGGRAHRARALLAPAAHPRRPVRGRAGHPPARRPGRRRAAHRRGPRPSPTRRPRPAPSSATPSTRRSSAPPLKIAQPVWWVALRCARSGSSRSAAVLGLAWLAVLVVMGWLPAARAGHHGWVPLPDPCCSLGWPVARAGPARRVARTAAGARRRAGAGDRLIAAAAARQVGGVARERIVAPVQAVLERHRTDTATAREAAGCPARREPAPGRHHGPSAASTQLPGPPDARAEVAGCPQRAGAGPTVHSRRGRSPGAGAAAAPDSGTHSAAVGGQHGRDR